jgi:ribosomal 50S subunit-associated protein YjgA (DUF615 family)
VLFPPRSELISLKPVGTGTPLAEGMLSYITRLAAINVVRVLDLLTRVLHWTAPSKPVRELSRTGNKVKRTIKVLEQKTLQTCLEHHTLLPLAPVLGTRVRSKQLRAWCPECLAEMTRQQKVVYDPFAWQLALVTCCWIHKRRLETHCHACRSSLKLGFRFFRSGYCYECGSWLGSTSRVKSSRCTKSELRQAEIIGYLIASSPLVNSRLLRRRLEKTLRRVAQIRFTGSLERLKEASNGKSHVITDFMRGKNFVTLENLLYLIRRYQIPLDSLLFGVEPSSLEVRRIKRTAPGWFSNRRKREYVRREMLKALESAKSVSPAALADRLGYANCASLRQVDPKLYRRIQDNYNSKSSRTPRRGALEIKAVLQENRQRENPFSLWKLVLKYRLPQPKALRREFPDLCKAIDRKRQQSIESEHKRIAEGMKRALKTVPPLTLPEVSRLLGVSVAKLRFHTHLYVRLVQRFQRYRDKLIAEQRVALAKMLKEYPPSTLSEARRRLGITQSPMINHPGLARQLVRRRKAYLLKQKKEHEKRLFNNIVESVRTLVAEERSITVSSVAEETKKRGTGWIDSRAEPMVERAVKLLQAGGRGGGGALQKKAA